MAGAGALLFVAIVLIRVPAKFAEAVSLGAGAYLDGQPLRNGVNWLYCGLLVVVATAFAMLWRFRSRVT